ncbi:Tat pathway signal sequence domain protein [Streptomyces sp. YIM 121038]|uniref:Tat pathway signal sequence domain protein n=1 Tax=Streptomyces sp. YIM 121038 TaxID=2136401 RepID=UPI001486A8D5|nr:Tat pathway signal sequence domain protein [Streptomyces sp. YIM 121038]
MRKLVRRHLGKVVAGGALAVAATAALVAVTLPDRAGESDRSTAAGSSRQDAVAPDGTVEAAPDEGSEGVGSDPLTDAETARAQKIALDSNGLRSRARDVEGDRGPERLSTNLAENEPGATGDDAARRAEIVYYDYKKDAVVAKTVNLKTGEVESTNTAQNVQPPPSEEELTEAARLLIADGHGKGLRDDYEKATGKKLEGPSDLDLSGFVFRKETLDSVPADLQDCGKHRCIQVVAKVKNGPWIDTRAFIVDLSDRHVGRVR